MRPVVVVVPDAAAQDVSQMMSVEDEEVVEAFRSNRSYEALGVSVGIRGPKRCAQYLSTASGEDGVETRDVFGVPVAEKELYLDALIVNAAVTFRACWVTKAESGWAVTPVIQTRRRPSSMKKST